MKKNAWTLAELITALTIIILLSGFMISMYKPNTNKRRVMVNSVIRNLTQANSALIETDELLNSTFDLIKYPNASNLDWYCTKLTNILSIKGSPDCTATNNATNTKVNATLANGVTIQGLANKWVKPYDTADYEIKDILLDVNGSKGPNKVWLDRYPVRVYSGNKYTGMFTPIDCSKSSETFYDKDTNAIKSNSYSRTVFCKNGYSSDGSVVATNFLNDTDIISHDVYKSDGDGDQVKATMIKASRSFAEADCGAYGGDGFYPEKHCEALGYRIYPECVTDAMCHYCQKTAVVAGDITWNICPNVANGMTTAGCKAYAAANNPTNKFCIVLTHRPRVGGGMFVEALVSDLDF